MANLPSAEFSPRIENGVLRWYAKDTFDVQVDLELEDQDHRPITLSSTDTVTFEFFNRSLRSVKKFTFTASDIEDNSVHLNFDEETSDLFFPGKYTLDVTVTHDGNVTTVAKASPVLVE